MSSIYKCPVYYVKNMTKAGDTNNTEDKQYYVIAYRLIIGVIPNRIVSIYKCGM